jgi:hypothetical protein
MGCECTDPRGLINDDEIMKTNRERVIEDAVIRSPEALGFPGATAIRNVRIAWMFGRVDVMLLPRDGPKKLVLVEAKHSEARDAISKVIGQLVMYYAGALRIGQVGLECYRRYAVEYRERALSSTWISPKALTGGMSPPEKAWEHIRSGRRIQPNEVALFVGLTAPPHDALLEAVEVLKERHSLLIGLAVADGERLRLIS